MNSPLKSTRSAVRRTDFAAVALAALSIISSTHAATLTWDPLHTGGSGGTGTWDTSLLNWYNAGTATDRAWTDTTGTADTAVFGGAVGTATLGANLGALGLTFQTTGYTIAPGSGPYTLTVGSGGINASALTSGTTAINADITLGANQTWSVGTGATLTTSGAITGSAGITKTGAGTLLLGQANSLLTTFDGGVSVNAGGLTIVNTNAAGSGTLAFANGTTFRIQPATGGVVLTNAMTVAPSSAVMFTSSSLASSYNGLISGDAASTIEFGAGTQVSFGLNTSTQQFGNFLGTVLVDDGAAIRFSPTTGINNGGASTSFNLLGTGNIYTRNGGTVNLGSLTGAGSLGVGTMIGTTTYSVGAKNLNSTFDGSIVNGGGTGALTKVGTGILTLTGANNNYTGATSVNGGTLIVNGIQTAATGAVGVAAGATLGGTGALGGAVTVTGSITGGTIGTAGTLTLASTVVFAETGNYVVDIVGNASDRLAMAGVFNLGGSTADQITFAGTPNGTSTYILATYGSVTGTFDKVNNLPNGYRLIYGSTQLSLAPVPEPSTLGLVAGLMAGAACWRHRRARSS